VESGSGMKEGCETNEYATTLDIGLLPAGLVVYNTVYTIYMPCYDLL